MKKSVLIFSVFILAINLCSCSYVNPVIDSLPKYTSEVLYSCDGFQDYTDYGKYTYESIDSQCLLETKYFKEISEDDVEEILLHIEDFEGWVANSDELEENYDFDKSIVSIGDYFYIETKYGQPIGQGTYDKFDNYTVYYFDIDNQILYYFHNNI